MLWFGGQTPPKRRVRRVAIIGPGLDFTDKQEGYDFYPQQTIQPFAIMDSLVRLGLARANELSVTTLDLSARVNDHVDGGVPARAPRITVPDSPARGCGCVVDA